MLASKNLFATKNNHNIKALIVQRFSGLPKTISHASFLAATWSFMIAMSGVAKIIVKTAFLCVVLINFGKS